MPALHPSLLKLEEPGTPRVWDSTRGTRACERSGEACNGPGQSPHASRWALLLWERAARKILESGLPLPSFPCLTSALCVTHTDTHTNTQDVVGVFFGGRVGL